MANITAVTFVETYLKWGGDLEATSKDLGIRKASAYQRVLKMRRAGVRLPVKRKAANSYNVKELNNLIREYKNVKQTT